MESSRKTVGIGEREFIVWTGSAYCFSVDATNPFSWRDAVNGAAERIRHD
jgi:hypothetical protein